jgi:hypothetical protein
MESIEEVSHYNYYFDSPIFQLSRPDNVLARVYLTIHPYRTIISRGYLKLQDLTAYIGRITEILVLVGHYLTMFFNKFTIQKMMINAFFFTPREDDKLPDSISFVKLIQKKAINNQPNIAIPNNPSSVIKFNIPDKSPQNKKNNYIEKKSTSIIDKMYEEDANESVYHLSKIDIIGMSFCSCFNRFNRIWNRHYKYYEKLIGFTDYERIIIESTNFKQFREKFEANSK